VITVEPPRVGTASYGVLVPQVDADGNDLGGVPSLYELVPIGTYTAWNQFQPAWFDGNFCNFNGSFVPFARTRSERAAAGDARPSLEERYPDKQAYVAAVGRAAAELVGQRFLLQEDATGWWPRPSGTGSGRGRDAGYRMPSVSADPPYWSDADARHPRLRLTQASHAPALMGPGRHR
jgi:hypothetical protein